MLKFEEDKECEFEDDPVCDYGDDFSAASTSRANLPRAAAFGAAVAGLVAATSVFF